MSEDHSDDGATDDRVARGRFDARLAPLAADPPGINRMTIAKSFHGDLSGTSSGLMLSAGDPATGAAGYVAMELVTATLAGRQGEFVFQHGGLIADGARSLSVVVVPGSAGGGLRGLAGTMTIDMAGGEHRYTFRYRLP